MPARKSGALVGLKKITVKSSRESSSSAAGKRIAAQIVDQMRDAIFSGMQPGDWIGTEAELAERFGVSKVPIRAAVQTLRAYGLVSVRVGSGGGLYVASEDPKHLGEALAVQIHLLGVHWEEAVEATTSLEPVLAALAAVRRSSEHLSRLRIVLDAQRKSLGDRTAFDLLSTEFHMEIAEAAGNRALLVASKAFRLNQENFRVNKEHPMLPRSGRSDAAKKVFNEHRLILASIEAKDSREAVRLTELHRRTLDVYRGPEELQSRRTRNAPERTSTTSDSTPHAAATVTTRGKPRQSPARTTEPGKGAPATAKPKKPTARPAVTGRAKTPRRASA
jgi:GntR family transcriptional repressor for pyruvate dehydrogenase complex